MPIRPYLAGRTFAPETIAIMSAAFEEACKALNLDANNPLRAKVAQTIISLEGASDSDRLDDLWGGLGLLLVIALIIAIVGAAALLDRMF